MLRRSFGAGSIAGFWRHWNPIWSYGLGRYILSPLRRLFPASLALLLTFATSGLIHDVVIMALRKELTLIFTPWFSLIGFCVVVSERLGWNFEQLSWVKRAGINLSILIACLTLALLLSAEFEIGL